MPQQPQVTLENNFIGGLKTEFTGLNFPENSATDTDNCVYTLIGEVLRREGIDFEAHYITTAVNRAGKAVSSYKWNNVGGDGQFQLVVVQVGTILYFFKSSVATNTSPLSAHLMNTADFSSFHVAGNVNDPSLTECQYADGNGYLFVFHPDCVTFYCFSDGGAGIGSTAITVLIRDFEGANSDASGLYSDTRPATLANDHQYNLQNQGWDLAKITKFFTDVGVYPSNSDVWWRYKNSTGIFDPAAKINSVLPSGPAPKGTYVINAFDQFRTATGTPLPEIAVTLRSKTGTWFAGRVWYVGADARSVGAHIFAENIYFSQVITTSDQFGFCYQLNSPSAEDLFDELPTDGGVIKIQGCGVIYKLFPVQNGLLVFAANGIWFITGSQGIGFAANDYTITRISAVQSISSTSFVNVLGYPMFWNEEGIYIVSPSQQGGGLTVDNLAIGTILSYYAAIPLQSKKLARGAYNPIDFIVQWTFKGTATDERDITGKYEFDKILNFNTSNKAFYPYSISGFPTVNGVIYVAGPGGTNSPAPVFKYLTSTYTLGTNNYRLTFSEENDGTHFVDWHTYDFTGVNYESFFVTGYRIHGQGVRRWQPGYVLVYSLNDTAYKIQNIWDYASDAKSGRWSSKQLISNTKPYFGSAFRRHRLRGQGLVNQIRISSVAGLPFNIYGWTVYELQNTGP